MSVRGATERLIPRYAGVLGAIHARKLVEETERSIMVRMSDSYGNVEPQYVSLRNELESHRRTASLSVTLAIGAAVFAAVFITAFLVI